MGWTGPSARPSWFLARMVPHDSTTRGAWVEREGAAGARLRATRARAATSEPACGSVSSAVWVSPSSLPLHHGPPPAPLVEERPPAPGATAAWTPGYWTWTGSEWGWIAGFWRDGRVALPVPRVELPGPPPQPGAIWIGGAWRLRAGAYVWIGGRWRR